MNDTNRTFWISTPASSLTSLVAHSSKDSFISKCPPGGHQVLRPCSFALTPNKTSLFLRTHTAVPIFGRSFSAILPHRFDTGSNFRDFAGNRGLADFVESAGKIWSHFIWLG